MRLLDESAKFTFLFMFDDSGCSWRDFAPTVLAWLRIGIDFFYVPPAVFVAVAAIYKRDIEPI